MKLGTQSVSANGPTAFPSGIPTVLPTNPNSPFAKLIVKSELGQIIQQWLVLQNKCTLGSASSCALRCQLTGIAPYHALLVMGARQVFIRALAPKLTRNGVMVNELLLTEEQSTFEIAGHQFELIRTVKTNEPTSSNKPSNAKLKFTLARPMEIGQVRQPLVIATQSQQAVPPRANEQSLPLTTSSELQPQWITDLIQSAMLPLERQLNGIIEPLAAVQLELDKRSKLKRKRRKRSVERPQQAETSEATLTTQIDVQPQIAQIPEPVIVPVISPEVQSQLAKQSETLDSLNVRLSDLKTNLGSLERMVSENFVTVIGAASTPVPTPEPVTESLHRITSVANQLTGLTTQIDGVRSNLGSLERIASENLASTNELRTAQDPTSVEALERINSVADKLNGLTTQLDELKGNLGSLGQIVSENLASTNELRTVQDPASVEALDRINLVADKLTGLTTQLDELKGNLGSLEQIVSENLASTNELKTVPEPASNEAMQRLTEVANQLSVLLQDMNARQVSTVDSDQAWREQLRTQIGELRESVTATESSILKATEIRQAMPRGTCPTSAALIANGHLRATIQSKPISIQPAAAPVVQSPIQNVATVPVVSVRPVVSERVEEPTSFATNGFAEQNLAEHSSSKTIEPAAKEEAAPPFSFAVNEVAETIAEAPIESEFEQSVESESLANLFNQYSWNPAPSQEAEIATGFEQSPAPEPTASVTGWEVHESQDSAPEIEFGETSANFIEETIEEAPLAEGLDSSALPSWWTDDDKTQFKDDSSASAAISAGLATPVESPSASPWNTASSFDGSASADSTFDSSVETPEAIEEFATYREAQSDLSDSDASSAWDVQTDAESVVIDEVSPAPAFTSYEAAIAEESQVEEPGSSDESEELSSLLERFGIAREPIADELQSRESTGFEREQVEAEPVEHTEIVHVQERDEAPEPVSHQPVSHQPEPIADSAIASEGGEEESIEDYMKRLMARMRGGSEEDVKPSSASAVTPAAATPKPASDLSSVKAAAPAPATERAAGSTTDPFNPEEYVPKALAPEKTRNMAAMRELANTSARSAIQVSARRRYGTAIALKLAIALTGLGVGATLIMINGLNVNIGLIATVASFLVALIWGFDAISTLKPLLYAVAENHESQTPPAEPEGTGIE